jgi:hypothetical protein
MVWFFFLTTTFILFIAAGLAMYSAHEFEELGKAHSAATNDPIILRPLWDISGCCTDQNGAGAVFRAIAGYQDKPTMIEALVYLGYWIFVLMLMVTRYKKGILFNKRRVRGGSRSISLPSEDENMENGAKIESGEVMGNRATLGFSAGPQQGVPMMNYGVTADGMQPLQMMQYPGMVGQPFFHPMQPMAGQPFYPGMFHSTLMQGAA